MSFKDKVRSLLSNSKLWRSVGSVSTVGGMACLALSPSFQRLIGKWYKWKIFVHVVLTVILTGFTLFAEKWQSSKRFWLKILIPYCVLIFSNVGSYYYDKAIGGKPDILGAISMGLLALSAVSLSRLIDMGFEVGFFTFFLGLFVVELLQIRRWLVVVGAIFCFLAIAVRVYSEESPKEAPRRKGDPVPQHTIDVDRQQGRASLNQTGGSGNGGSAVEGKESKEEVSEKPQPDPPKPKKKKAETGRPMALVPGPLRWRNQRT